jgi:hypothetical protein
VGSRQPPAGSSRLVGACVAVRYLTRCVRSRTLTSLASYCALASAASLIWLTLR